MGNYCCSNEENPHVLKQSNLGLAKKKRILDVNLQTQYQQKITALLNDLLHQKGGKEKIHQVKFKKLLGKGSHGEVYKVKVEGLKKDGQVFQKEFALKRISKKKLEKENLQHCAMVEK